VALNKSISAFCACVGPLSDLANFRALQVCFVAPPARESAAPASGRKLALHQTRPFAYEAGSSAGAHVSDSWLGNRSQLAPEQQVQQDLQQQAAGLGLPEVPTGLEGISGAYISASRALAAASNLIQAGYQWVHACLVVMAWEKALAAEQQLAAEQTVWDTYRAKVVSCPLSLCYGTCGHLVIHHAVYK
jgi:hypothetical protein